MNFIFSNFYMILCQVFSYTQSWGSSFYSIFTVNLNSDNLWKFINLYLKSDKFSSQSQEFLNPQTYSLLFCSLFKNRILLLIFSSQITDFSHISRASCTRRVWTAWKFSTNWFFLWKFSTTWFSEVMQVYFRERHWK